MYIYYFIVPCLKVAISKALGYAIILGAVVGKRLHAFL